MNGLDGLMYMSSTSDAAGNASITLTFETGTSPDIAQVQVQNKLQLAMPSLPEAVQQQGISVDKSSSNILMVAAFISDNITLTFETGTSPDIAQVQVQNKLQLAMPSLPEAVQQQGISVDKSSSNSLMVAAFISDNGSLNQYDIADYVASNIKDPLSRTAGVGSVQLFGSEYAMRIWLSRAVIV